MHFPGGQNHSFVRDLLGAELWGALSVDAPAPAARAAATARLRAALAALAAHVPTPLLRSQFVAPKPGHVMGAFWQGTTLFADLSGFTGLSGQLSTLGKQGAEELSALITALFGALSDEVHAHGGSLLKFGGDALTAFFDAATLGEAHAPFAAAAALAMQQRMDDFAAVVTPVGTFCLRLRIGVHSGPVFAAQVGDHEHNELVVTGHTINRVATAQEIAAPGEVVVSDASAALLWRPQTSPCQAGFVQLHSLPLTNRLTSRAAGWPELSDEAARLPGLIERIIALQPYLPHGLPQRFLHTSLGQLGEFRPVTTIFINFWPFSDLLDQMHHDATAAALVLNAYYRRVQAVVHRYGGIVNKVDLYTHGDKLMALFGAPLSHEDDAERAVRCALELHEALEAANHELREQDLVPLSQKIGLATGTVFAGIVGGAHRHEYTVMGQPVNLAARVMGQAAPGTVLLAPSSVRVLGARVRLRQLAPVALKGISEPVSLAVVEGLHEASPATALGQGALVGREAELAQTQVIAAQALAGAGRVLALVGAAGTGKSRLADALLPSLAPDATIISVASQSYAQISPASTVRSLVQALVAPALAANDPVTALQAYCAHHAPELARFAPLLGELVGVRLPETPLITALTPEQRAERLRAMVLALLHGTARQQPLVVVLDDLHWADAFSLDLLNTLADSITEVALLLVLIYRPEGGFAEPGQTHATRIELSELDPAQSLTLVSQLLDGSPPSGLIPLLEKAQGNPLFVEALVQSLIETGDLVREPEGWQLRRTPEALHVPDRIEGLLTARLDRIEEQARETLKVAAVIGQRFGYAVLAAVRTQANDLAAQLRRLDYAAMITNEAPLPAPTYLFRHTLIREVAYDALLYAQRRELHRRVAEVLVQLGADGDEAQLAVLAQHYLLAERWPEALRYHLQAGRMAQRRYANHEAILLLTQALQLGTGTREPFAANAATRTEIHERLGWLHTLAGAYDQALEHYQQALELVPADPPDDRLRLHHHIAQVAEKRADFETAFGWIERGLALNPAHDRPATVRCLLLGAGLHQRQGRYPQALEWGERALAASAQIEAHHLQAEALMLLGGTYSLLGEHTRAHELTSRCLALAETSGDLNRLADAYNNLALIDQDLGRFEAALQHYQRGAELKQQIGDVYGEALIANNLGDLLKLRGDLTGAVAQFTRSLASFERLGSIYGAGVVRINLGVTQLLHGDLSAAAADFDRAEALLNQVGAEEFGSELARHRAELALAQDDLVAAQRFADAALDSAVRLEARADEGLARRVIATVLAATGAYALAWEQLNLGLALLYEADSPFEIALALLDLAQLGLSLERRSEGQAALDAALPMLRELDARPELARAEELLARYRAGA